MPANGIRIAETSFAGCRASSHCAPSSAPSGSAVRIRISAVPNSSPNNTPAKAAARGVVSGCGSRRCHGWPGSSRIIRPLASASRLPSGSRSSALTNALRPSVLSTQPRMVSGVSMGVTFR